MKETICSCGRPIQWTDHGVIIQGTHGARHGVIWTRNNETYIRRAPWSSRRAPNQRHLGTFQNLELAQQALTRVLSRGQH